MQKKEHLPSKCYSMIVIKRLNKSWGKLWILKHLQQLVVWLTADIFVKVEKVRAN